MLDDSAMMYSDWTSLTDDLSCLGERNQSVLVKLPPEDALKVVCCVAKNVSSGLGAGQSSVPQAADPKPSPITKQQEVDWLMEVFCYGLSLPLTEHETVRACVDVYCEWLSALLPEPPKASVPQPVVQEANRFARKIIQHLFHLFVPRTNQSQDTISRQAVLSHRVLRRIQDVVQQSKTIDRDTWETLLGFLLAINDALLAPPTVRDDVGDQLSARVLGVLYEIWLVACVKCYPSPSLWKTFQEMAAHWRHRLGLVDQWNRVCIALTKKMVSFMFGPQYLAFSKRVEDISGSSSGLVISEEMSNECVAQTWYCFLHSLGNPVDLSRPALVSQTQSFYQYAIVSEDVIDPTHHPCLSHLPEIFLRSMKGLAAIVDIFLAASRDDPRIHHINRPRCNSILHLLGQWLMEAALIGSPFLINSTTADKPEGSEVSDPPQQQQQQPLLLLHPATPTTPLPTPSPTNLKPELSSSSKLGIFRKSSTSVTSPTPASSTAATSVASTAAPSVTSGLELPEALTPTRFQSGRAEAIGALCRIFCAKKTDETISPIYLARFYIALHEGLATAKGNEVSEVLSKILVNCKDIYLTDLDGSLTMMPRLLSALEAVLPSQLLDEQLRSAAIHILATMLPFPARYGDLDIKDILPITDNSPKLKFSDLQKRISDLLFKAIEVENTAKNVHHLLGGLMFLVLDFAKMKNEGSSAGAGSKPYSSLSHLLFVKATHLVCHRLISSWKSDLNTSLAALELLGGLARTEIPLRGALECKRTVKWLCDFIVTQCSRPPPAHSKDLHSSIVAAFYCCRTWILHHPYLLQDKECTATVMEVVELGISGSKSNQSKGGDTATLKEDKVLSPASRRVKDAAESLLITLLEQVGQEPSPKQGQYETAHSQVVEDTEFYRYFVIDNSIILAMIEEPVEDEYNPQPMVTVIIRGPSCKSTWTMQLRHLPLHKAGDKLSLSNLGRPLAMEDNTARPSVQPSFFPDTVDKIPLCNADKSIPAVESVALDERSILELDDLSRIVVDQTSREILASEQDGQAEDDVYHVETECQAPEVCTEFQTARLVLNHLGYFNPAALKESLTSAMPRVVALSSNQDEFIRDLNTIDEISAKTVDNIFVYYVKNGQKHAHDILNNIEGGQIEANFLDFLRTLGRPMRNKCVSSQQQHMKRSLYWSDASSEMMFYVPSAAASESNQLPTANGGPGIKLHRQLSSGLSGVSTDVRILLVWLESYEDFQNFPFEEIFAGISAEGNSQQQQQQHLAHPHHHHHKDSFTIFIHELKSGLLRINLKTHGMRTHFSSPLVDGMIVSRRSLGPLVRQTALNVSTRKRLEQENYQPSHIRRKLKIQELAAKYRCQLTTSEFYANLV